MRSDASYALNFFPKNRLQLFTVTLCALRLPLCLVSGPRYVAFINRFRVTWSGFSSQIGHRNQLTMKACEKAVQETYGSSRTSPQERFRDELEERVLYRLALGRTTRSATDLLNRFTREQIW